MSGALSPQKLYAALAEIAQRGGHMAEETKTSSDLLTGAAEMVGGALGTIAGAVDRLRADHPHPVDEAKEALAAGQKQVAQVAAEATQRATVMIDATKAVIKKVRRKSASVRARAARPPLSRAMRTAKPVKRAAKKKAAKPARKQKPLKRASKARKTKPAKRAKKKVVARFRKPAAKSRAAARLRKR
jgi:hypothetical protein